MSHVLITSTPAPANVYSLVPIAAALVDRGVTVTFLTSAGYRSAVEETGARFEALPENLSVTPAQLLADRPNRKVNGVQEIRTTLRRAFLWPLEHQYTIVTRLIKELEIDAVLTDPVFLGATALALAPPETRPPVIAVGIFPLPVSGVDVAPFGLGLAPRQDSFNVLRNVILEFIARYVLLAGITAEVKREARRVTGFRLRGTLSNAVLLTDAYAQLTVQAFEYPRRHLSKRVHFVGPPQPPRSFTLPDWWDRDHDQKIVYVSQGASGFMDPTELIIPTIRAMADEPVVTVVTTGSTPVHVIRAAYGGPLPDNCRVEQYLPYGHLLPAASVMVTNGGYLATQHALRWGVPLVSCGTTEDKVEVNARVAWSGVGINMKTQRPDADSLKSAIRTVLRDRRYADASNRIGSRIARSHAEAEIADLVSSLASKRRAAADIASATKA